MCEEDAFHLVDGESSPVENPLVRLYTFFLLMFQSLFRLSDAALNVLLVFFSMFFTTLSHNIAVIPQAFVSNLPRNVQSARNIAGSSRSSLQQFVCCPSCHSLYKRDDCSLQNPDGEIVSQRCMFK